MELTVTIKKADLIRSAVVEICNKCHDEGWRCCDSDCPLFDSDLTRVFGKDTVSFKATVTEARKMYYDE